MAKAINPFLEESVPPFTGFPKDALTFFRQLKKHNTREWFAENKERFENAIREPMESLLAELALRMRAVDPDIMIDPKKSPYRIYRDTRFSADKTPYKTWIAASFTMHGLHRNTAPGYYFQVSPDDVGIGGGLYMASSDQLKRLRAAIDRDASQLRSIVAEKRFRKYFDGIQGDSLSRVPQGYEKDHPAADLLKRKQFFCWASLPAVSALDHALVDELVTRFQAMTPFVRWLITHA